MKKTKKIELHITLEQLELLRKMGFTPEDVFSQGFEMILRRKFREVSMMDDEEEDDLEIMEINELPSKIYDINEFLVRDDDIANN